MEKYSFSETERSLMEGSAIPFAVYQFIDERVVTLVLSDGFCRLFGYTDRAKACFDMDNDMYKNVHRSDAARVADAALRFAVDGGSYDVIYRTANGKGGYRLIHAHGEHSYTDTGIRLAQVWYTDEGECGEDEVITERTVSDAIKSALYEESFLKASYYDHLTGLPSMTCFFEFADSAKLRIREKGCTPVVLFTDFCGMKYFNHRFGFAEGDRLLQSFARLLADRFGSDCCSRIGQDHFAAVTEDEGLEERLRQLFDDCTRINEGRTLALHVGVYKHWFDGIAASMACDRAKSACDMLSGVLSSDFRCYDMSMKEAEDKQQYIIANLDKAIQERWIKVYYQPIVRAVNGRVCDEEALARWFDPVKGFMSPGDFIPVLEEHRLIHKLDLYVVDCVLQKIKTLGGAGLYLMPQSVNLSRYDFDSCDIVEEICRRVDAAGISHSMLTIEVTESVIAKDFEFMKQQIDRFRERGFAVWMDDFGSGYSSLDVLQSMKFDLIKFDMRFMQSFGKDETDKSKIILTELLRMANSLGIDTVCEGVETEEQVRFLRETGCSKLQGYYYEKPVSVERILEKYAKGIQIGFEDPYESEYFENIGRVNLHDLSSVSAGEVKGFGNYFNVLPMAVIELCGGLIRFARSNRTYRDFMQRFFGITINDKAESFRDNDKAGESPFLKAVLHSCGTDENVFVDEHLPGNITVHSCMRRVAVNPVTGTVAVVVAVLSVTRAEQGTTYVNIARALAADYFNLYYVDIENDTFTEYSPRASIDDLAMERHGEDFFGASRKDALKYIYREDREAFIKAFTKENILSALDSEGTFKATYRLLSGGEPIYVIMKAMRMQHDRGHIIIGISSIDQQMKEKAMLEDIRRNEVTYRRVMALSGDIVCMYSVDPESEDYVVHSPSDAYKGLGLAENGSSFFAQSQKDGAVIVAPEYLTMFRERFTKENILNEIAQKGVCTLSYAILVEGREIPVVLRGALVPEEDGEKLIIGIYKRK